MVERWNWWKNVFFEKFAVKNIKEFGNMNVENTGYRKSC